MMHRKLIAPSVVALGLLTGCFGGGGDSDTPPVVTPGIEYVADSGVPAAAEKQVTEVISFSQTQIAATSESLDPVLLANAMLATSDTTEPSEI